MESRASTRPPTPTSTCPRARARAQQARGRHANKAAAPTKSGQRAWKPSSAAPGPRAPNGRRGSPQCPASSAPSGGRSGQLSWALPRGPSGSGVGSGPQSRPKVGDNDACVPRLRLLRRPRLATRKPPNRLLLLPRLQSPPPFRCAPTPMCWRAGTRARERRTKHDACQGHVARHRAPSSINGIASSPRPAGPALTPCSSIAHATSNARS